MRMKSAHDVRERRRNFTRRRYCLLFDFLLHYAPDAAMAFSAHDAAVSHAIICHTLFIRRRRHYCPPFSLMPLSLPFFADSCRLRHDAAYCCHEDAAYADDSLSSSARSDGARRATRCLSANADAASRNQTHQSLKKRADEAQTSDAHASDAMPTHDKPSARAAGLLRCWRRRRVCAHDPDA